MVSSRVLFILAGCLFLQIENPYQAAHRFLGKNNISLTYIDEVAKFIEKNTSAVNIGASNEQYVDPYTGESIHRSS